MLIYMLSCGFRVMSDFIKNSTQYDFSPRSFLKPNKNKDCTLVIRATMINPLE